MSSPFVDYPKPVCSKCKSNTCEDCDNIIISYNELVKKHNKLILKIRELKKELEIERSINNKL
jgi:hypothetical protein